MRKYSIITETLLFASLAANAYLWSIACKPAEVRVETRTEYVTIRDTIPTEKESRYTGERMTAKAVIHRHAKNHRPDKPAEEMEPDTLPAVSIAGDSAIITLPVEQKVYEDSLYTAYVSGYNPRLDSIELRMPHTYTTITKTVGRTPRKWAAGPMVGAGYGIAGRRWDVFVGVSLTLNLFK